MLTQKVIPHYYLYGETQQNDELEFLHIEKIAYRSAQNNWEITPHRHDNLMQLLYLEKGHLEASIDGSLKRHNAPCLLCIPATVVHGFIVNPTTEGYVLSVSTVFLHSIFSQAEMLVIQGITAHAGAIRIDSRTQNHLQIASLIENIESEFRARKVGRIAITAGYLKVLLVSIAREAEIIQSASANCAPYLGLYREFEKLIEEQYRNHLTVPDYCKLLNITDNRLYSICRSVVDQTPTHLCHERLLLEAKRSLFYTVMSITELSYDLGFREPAHFSKFFCNGVGMSPSVFREKVSAQ